jgi:hypothetical protein
MATSQSIDPRFIINDHFREIIYKINMTTDSLLEEQGLSDAKRDALNETRKRQLEKLKEIEQLNLDRLSGEVNRNEFGQKWSHVLHNNSLDYQNKIGLIKQRELICFDCALLENSKLVNGLDLWITSWFFDEENLKFLK